MTSSANTNKETPLEKAKSYTAMYGTVYQDSHLWEDKDYFENDGTPLFRLSKLKIWTGKLENKEVIVGMQTFYKNLNNLKDETKGEMRDKELEFDDCKEIEVAPNDFIINFNFNVGNEVISYMKFKTIKGKVYEFGTADFGESKITKLSDGRENVLLYFSGRYRKHLECIAAGFIDLTKYLINSRGFFELRKKLKKNVEFKNIVVKNKDKYDKADRILIKIAVEMPDNVFNEIIKFCLY